MNKLLQISKPLRYAGGESGQVMKDPSDRLRFCLVFPDVYEIGMSCTGYKLVYSALNAIDSVYAERFFAPWPDAYEKLGSDIMVSLETHTPIGQFDMLGFSMQYELAYSTAVALLHMANIPLMSAERGENVPIIAAGGSCILNPAPLADIIDVFFMGEMDDAITAPMEELARMKKAGASRRSCLEMLNSYPFAYVPQIDADKKVTRAIYSGFADDGSLPQPLVPLMDIVQDRVTVELARGCTNGCRFCQAGMIYRPIREKSVASIMSSALCQLEQTGYTEVSLLSLDSGDYSRIVPLLEEMSARLDRRSVALSLPSLRAETVSEELLSKAGGVRKSGFTIAPEAGSQRLRDVINKNLSEEDIINAALHAKNAGYKGAKLYFMCGLPYETDEDLLAIADLVDNIRRAAGKSFNITVSVSNFVPKAHTPFESLPQNSRAEFRRKQFLVKDALKPLKVLFKGHSVAVSRMEAVFSRGDRRLSKVLALAAERGFYLDAWSEFFDESRWEAVFEECGLAPDDFAQRAFADDEELPWWMVQAGPGRAFMQKERLFAEKAITTPDCRHGECTACGVCDFKEIRNQEAADTMPEADETPQEPVWGKYRLLFEKKDTAAMMSALDLSRIIAMAFTGAGIAFKFSQGFNPSPRLLIYAPMPVGVAGEREMLFFEADVRSVEKCSLDKINSRCPAGLCFFHMDQEPWPENLSRASMKLVFDEAGFTFIMKSLKNDEAYYDKTDKKGRPKQVNLKDFLEESLPEERALRVSVTEKGGFHFPEFFRFRQYGLAEIVRVELA